LIISGGIAVVSEGENGCFWGVVFNSFLEKTMKYSLSSLLAAGLLCTAAQLNALDIATVFVGDAKDGCGHP
jgi:hypothetical protein